MPGGWTMSMMWMRMPGQSWLGSATSFLGMWTVMMVAMMLPSLAPALWRYRVSLGVASPARGSGMTLLVGMAFFAVWATIGALVFPIGVEVARVVMNQPVVARSVPMLGGAILLLAGLLQHTGWKARRLEFCREGVTHLTPVAGPRVALRHGWCLGLHCVRSCAGFTAVVLTAGVMDLRVMTLVTVAITAERLARNGAGVARAIGVVGVAVGLAVMVRLA